MREIDLLRREKSFDATQILFFGKSGAAWEKKLKEKREKRVR